MSVKSASEFVTRAMRAAIKETIVPANEVVNTSSEKNPIDEAGKISRHFGHELHQRLHAYTGTVDEFAGTANVVDSWRLQFSRRDGGFKPANGVGDKR